MSIRETLKEEFGSVAFACKKLGISRNAIYRAEKTGLSDALRDRIRGRGYNPDTFKPILHVMNP